jgi:hypothetical protein
LLSGVLSVDELLGVLPLLPPLVAGVEVFLGTPDPNPTGVGLKLDCLDPDLKLDVLLALDPLRPSSESLRDTFDPCRLGGRDPGCDPGVREDRPWVALDVRRENESSPP